MKPITAERLLEATHLIVDTCIDRAKKYRHLRRCQHSCNHIEWTASGAISLFNILYNGKDKEEKLEALIKKENSFNDIWNEQCE